VERIGGFAVRRLPLPTGDAGTRMTLGYMRQLATEGSKDLEVRSAAIEALDRYGAQDHDPIGALRSVYRYVRDRIRFVPDPVGTQGIQSPRATLELGAGNCAQRATLIAAMARSIGIPAGLKFRVIAANPRRPRDFSHVYAVAQIGGREIALDPTYRSNPFGYEYPRATRMGDYAVIPYPTPSRCHMMTPTGGPSGLGLLPLAPFVAKTIGGQILSMAANLGRKVCREGGVEIPCSESLITRARVAMQASKAAAIRGPAFSGGGGLKARAIQLAASRRVAPAATPYSSVASVATPIQPVSYSVAESGGGGGGGGGGGVGPVTEAAEAATAPPSAPPGIGIAIVAGIVLLALMSGRRRRN
jgi:hypothetical protein